jgi:hypothetical protein
MKAEPKVLALTRQGCWRGQILISMTLWQIRLSLIMSMIQPTNANLLANLQQIKSLRLLILRRQMIHLNNHSLQAQPMAPYQMIWLASHLTVATSRG